MLHVQVCVNLRVHMYVREYNVTLCVDKCVCIGINAFTHARTHTHTYIVWNIIFDFIVIVSKMSLNQIEQWRCQQTTLVANDQLALILTIRSPTS